MRLTTLTAALAVTLAFAQSAHAREHLHRHGIEAEQSIIVRGSAAPGYFASAPEGYAPWGASPGPSTSRAAYVGRPRAWCGWQMPQLVGSDPGSQFNLARNWARWGHAGPVGVGAIVVWPHHVGKIVGQEGGMWIIESGNDGNRVRTRPLLIAGAIAIRWS